jgi:hypothetical protein
MAAATPPDSHKSRSKTTDDSIRRVFLSRQNSYAPNEAAEALGWTPSEVKRAIDAGIVTVAPEHWGPRIAWREIAVMLTGRYPQAEIESALGPAMTSVIPETVRLAALQIRIPRYQVVMLAKLAGREGISVDELMSRHLLDLAGSEVDWLRRRIRGFVAAMRWPEE